VLDPSGRAKFVGAPRRYQMPIRALAATLEDRHELNASLILDKQGIVRIEYHASGNRRWFARQKRSCRKGATSRFCAPD
jgi:hypothetical protein